MRNLTCLSVLVGLIVGGAWTGLGCSKASDDASATSDLVTSPDLVIRQVFGGGGNTGAPYKSDFVELFNRGNAPVSLSGKSLQYASSTAAFSATSNVVALPAATIPAGGSYLIQLGGGMAGADLPAPDLVTSGVTALTLTKDKGKLALAPSAALLDACGTAAALCDPAAYIDLVGYGTGTVQAEGSATGFLSNTTAASRKEGGCKDSGDNSADFDVVAPTPRNSASAATPCAAQDGGSSSGGSDASASSDAGATTTDASSAASDATAPSTTDGAPGPATSFVLLTEVKINPPGSTDSPWEYAELSCAPGASLAGYYFVAFEGDGDSSTGSPGSADIVVNLGSTNCGSNGLVYIKAAAGGLAALSSATTTVTTTALDTGSSPFENATTSFVVVKSPTAPIVQGTDYDPDNTGTLVLPAGASVVDGVSTFQQSDAAIDQTYAPRLSQPMAEAATRIVGNTTPMAAAAWYWGELSGTTGDGVMYDPAKSSASTPTGAKLTPGGLNFAAGSAPSADEDASANPTDPSEPGEPPADESTSSSGSSSKPPAKRGNSVAPSSTPGASSDGCAAAPGPSPAGGAGGLMTAAFALLLGAVARRRRRGA